MTLIADYIRRIETEDLPRLRESLAPLESGQMRLGTRRQGETGFADVTSDHIAMLKRAIATYEDIVQQLRKEFRFND